MRHPRAVLALLAVFWSAALPAAIIGGPFQYTGNGHTYYLLSSNSWTAAEAEAIGLGGHLATINDQEENDWIYQTFANYGGAPRGLWIGLNDVAQEGVFVWASGEPLVFTNWGAEEPNNSGGDEDYVHLINPPDYRVSRWNDAPNANNGGIGSYGVVELTSSLTVTSIIWTAVEIGWTSQTNRNYQVQRTSDLLSPDWQNLGGPVAGNGSTNSVFDNTRTADKRYYRILIVP